ncbi:hypothetical protein P167DRAFT_550419, partial [Morchella conica CCBAS932]
APEGLEAHEVQDVLDKAMYEKAKTKRRYDNKRFEDEFQDGGRFFNALIDSARLIFARYFCILDEWIPQLINDARGQVVDIASPGYLKAYNRLMAWRKNWFSDYFIDVDALQRRIQNENRGFAALPVPELRDTYASKWSFADFYSLLGTKRAVVDWGTTLHNAHMEALYKTIYTYSLIYSHRARHEPGTFTRGEAFDRPPSKVRYKKSKKRNLEKDDLFIPFVNVEEVVAGVAVSNVAAVDPLMTAIDPLVTDTAGPSVTPTAPVARRAPAMMVSNPPSPLIQRESSEETGAEQHF